MLSQSQSDFCKEEIYMNIQTTGSQQQQNSWLNNLV